MDSQKENYKRQVENLIYLQEINDDSIWNSYKNVVPYALKEVMPESVQPETMQMLSRFTARLFLDSQEERKEPAPQVVIVDTVPREEFESLKTIVYDLKSELGDLRKDNKLLRQELQSLRYESMQSNQSPIILRLNDQDKSDRQGDETEIE